MTKGSELEQAAHLAEELLCDKPNRLAHVREVAETARRVTGACGIDPDLLISAAWLHDIGYADAAVQTGFHPLDGARYLRSIAFDERVVSLVAHHSFAVLEAWERGLEGVLTAEFVAPPAELADALCFCDMTTGPTGDDVTLDERLTEIRVRYGAEHIVTRFIDRAEPELRAAIARVEARLTGTAALTVSRGRARRCRRGDGRDVCASRDAS
ncbi:MAG TPA: HDIG domain-containing protein [Nocardioidaceae bacterium]|nr:HDIG domain-containing protein [Nocardioidaceae bacterium]